MKNIKIVEYEDKYSEELSKIIIKNLLEINSKDYGMEYALKHAEEFTVQKIRENFPGRTKVLVALEGDRVVGTAGFDKSWYSDDNEYYVLTVFVDMEYHKSGIGRLLMTEVENYAKMVKAKRLVVPASIYGCEFYHKLGYQYINGEKILNDEKMYIMEKFL